MQKLFLSEFNEFATCTTIVALSRKSALDKITNEGDLKSLFILLLLDFWGMFMWAQEGCHSTVIQETLKIGQKYSTVSRAQERLSKSAVRSKRISGRAAEQVAQYYHFHFKKPEEEIAPANIPQVPANIP